jgi:Glycosyl hydrolases family 16
VSSKVRLTLIFVGLALSGVVMATAVPLLGAKPARNLSAARPQPCLEQPDRSPCPPSASWPPSPAASPSASSLASPSLSESATPESATPEPRSSRSQAPATSLGSTAAARYGWTNLVAREDFSGSSLPESWGAYNGAASGEGVYSPDQIRVGDGIARLIGTPGGKTGGMYWKGSQKYGRWEIRARFPAGCGCYTPVLILWPHDNDWPAGGEIDYAEVYSAARQRLHFHLHYGADDNVIEASKTVDMTRWHNFAVEWTPSHISGYIDGQRYFHTTKRSAQPPEPMFQTVQLDYSSNKKSGSATMEIDWAAKYAL